MNRKKFLKQTASGLVAASFLPLLSFTKKPNSKKAKSPYYSIKPTEINGDLWNFKVGISDQIFKDFSASSKGARQFDIYADRGKDEEVVLEYDAISIKKKMVDSKELYFITCKLNKEDMDDLSKNLAKQTFGNETTIEAHENCHVFLRNKSSKLEVALKYKENTDVDPDVDCFLTSATVFHKGLSDDCVELTTLRNLRETVMKPNPEYFPLISEYEIIAPKMLININAASNKDEILESIYTNLVVPSVSLVEIGRNTEAIKYYRDFVEKMKALYL